MNNHAMRIARLTDGQIVDCSLLFEMSIGFDSATIGFGAGVSENITSDD